MAMEKEPEIHLQQESEARSKCGPCSMITVSVSSVSSKDENNYLSNVMVQIDGRNKYLGAALLDTGSAPSLVSKSTADRAVDRKLTSIQPSDIKSLEGIAPGKKIPVLGKIRLKFSLDDVRYKNTFFVIPDDDRFDMLLGAKFIKKSGLLRPRAKSAEQLAGRL